MTPVEFIESVNLTVLPVIGAYSVCRIPLPTEKTRRQIWIACHSYYLLNTTDTWRAYARLNLMLNNDVVLTLPVIFGNSQPIAQGPLNQVVSNIEGGSLPEMVVRKGSASLEDARIGGFEIPSIEADSAELIQEAVYANGSILFVRGLRVWNFAE